MIPKSPGKSAPPVMRVHVNRERCQGHALCNAILPEIFALDMLGIARAIGHGIVPPALTERARIVKDFCPEHAIDIVEG